MELNTVIQRLKDSENVATKTASAVAPSNAPTADVLRQTLQQALAGTEKTAAAADNAPIDAMMKIASDLVSAEEEALMKQAQVYGAAICDGFMTRYAQYEKAANDVAPAMKTASDSFEKFAQENPELTKEAYTLGYHTKMAELQSEYQRGFNDTIDAIHKTAAALYKHGSEWAQWAVRVADAQQG